MQLSEESDKKVRRVNAFKVLWGRLKEHPLARLGPGLITGVADDDPSGIATYSQAGAQFGLNMLWTMPLAYPLMSAVQAMCAQIRRVTGKGLAANIKTAFPPIVPKSGVLLLLIANPLNTAADVAAMAEVAELVSDTLPYIQSGVLRALMTTGTQRSSLLPDVPTVRELGYPSIEEDDWFGIFVPAKTPLEIVNALNTATRAALNTNDVKAGLAKLSYAPDRSSPDEFAGLVKSEFGRWGPIVQASGYKVEN